MLCAREPFCLLIACQLLPVASHHSYMNGILCIAWCPTTLLMSTSSEKSILLLSRGGIAFANLLVPQALVVVIGAYFNYV